MKVEIRSDSISLDGYVNVVNRESRVLENAQGKFIEHIVPGAFQRAIEKADDIKLLFNHSKERELGSVKAGNLILKEDAIGLRAKCTVYDEEVIKKARNNELRGWSFGFGVLSEKNIELEDGIRRRSVSELRLDEVSILDKTPAYFATSIEERSGEEVCVYERRSFDDDSIEVICHEEKRKIDSADLLSAFFNAFNQK